MITKERKALLVDLAQSTTQTIQVLCKGDEELEFVITTMAKAEGYACAIQDIRKKCAKILQAALFKD